MISSSYGQIQLIAEFEFDGGDQINFAAAPNGECDGNTGIFGINNGRFEIRDVEGTPTSCCPCAAGGTGGDCGNNGTLTTTDGFISLVGFCNVTVRADVTPVGSLECTQQNLAPVCGPPDIDPGRDMMRIDILTAGGQILLGGYCGSNQQGTFEVNDINETFITLAITGGTQDGDEAYYIERIVVEGFQAPLFVPNISGPAGDLCANQDNLLMIVPPPGIPGETFEWFLDGVSLGTGFGNTYSPGLVTAADAGSYTVEITVPGNCNFATQAFDVSVISCAPTVPTFNFPTSYCYDTDRLNLPNTSNEGIPGTWNVPIDLELNTVPPIDTLIFIPDPGTNADTARIALSLDSFPVMGNFPPSGTIEVCVTEGQNVSVDLMSELDLQLTEIFEVTGLGQTITNPSDLDIDVSNIASGTYPLTFLSIPAGQCNQVTETVDLVLTKLDTGVDVSIRQCFQDMAVLNFLDSIQSQDPTGRWNDLDLSGLNLSQPANIMTTGLKNGTYRFDYTVGGTGSCPSLTFVSRLTLEILPSGLDNASTVEMLDLCPGDSLVIGTEIFDENRLSDNVTLVGAAANGCDSVVIVNIGYLQDATGLAPYDGCEGDGFEVTVNGNLYNEARNTGTERIINGAANGCDSIVTIDLVFKPVPRTSIDSIVCTGDGTSITVGLNTYNEANPSGIDTLMGINGCDSIITTTLTFLAEPMPIMISHDGCEDDGVFFEINGNRYDEQFTSGNETLDALIGCDTAVVIDLLYKPPGRNLIREFHLLGSGYDTLINGVVYDEGNPSDTVILMGAADNGCDSIIEVNLIFLDAVTESLVIDTLCMGEDFSIMPKDVEYNEMNPMGIDTFMLPDGRDSFLIVELTYQENPSINVVIFKTRGSGFDTIINGTFYNEMFPSDADTLLRAAANGCDSIVLVNLTFLDPVIVNFDTTICFGDDFTFMTDKTLYDRQLPMGSDTFPSVLGIDSIVNVNITYLEEISSSFDTILRIGDPYTFTQVNGRVYDENNPSGSDTLTSMQDPMCDSIVFINLRFLVAELDSLVIDTLCQGDDFSYMSGDNIYNEANPFGIDTFLLDDGRDSFFITRLTFLTNPVDTLQFVRTSGSGFDTMINGRLYNESMPINVDTLFGAAANGCDSIVYVEFSFLEAIIVNIDTAICFGQSFSVIIDNTTYDRDRPIGSDTFQTSTGIDSIINVNIDFLDRPVLIFDTTLCRGDDFQFFVGDTVYNELNPSGIDTLFGANRNGCDSFVQVLLRYQDVIRITIDDSICVGDEIIVNGMSYSSDNQTGMDTISGITGCDTIYTIDLKIDSIITDFSQTEACPGSSDGSITITNLRPGESYDVEVNGDVFTLSGNPLVIDNLPAGQSDIAVMNDRGCVLSTFVNIEERDIDPPVITTSDIGSDSLELTFTFDGIIDSLTWFNDTQELCRDCNSIIIDGLSPSTYTLMIWEASGCILESTFTILPPDGNLDSLNFFVPNAIAPSSSTGNDRFFLSTADRSILSYGLEIFSRWGEKLYDRGNLTPNDNSQGWDGRFGNQEIQQGVYVYFMRIVTIGGNSRVVTGDILVVD